jgi:hypothetical protein
MGSTMGMRGRNNDPTTTSCLFMGWKNRTTTANCHCKELLMPVGGGNMHINSDTNNGEGDNTRMMGMTQQPQLSNDYDDERKTSTRMAIIITTHGLYSTPNCHHKHGE